MYHQQAHQQHQQQDFYAPSNGRPMDPRWSQYQHQQQFGGQYNQYGHYDQQHYNYNQPFFAQGGGARHNVPVSYPVFYGPNQRQDQDVYQQQQRQQRHRQPVSAQGRLLRTVPLQQQEQQQQHQQQYQQQPQQQQPYQGQGFQGRLSTDTSHQRQQLMSVMQGSCRQPQQQGPQAENAVSGLRSREELVQRQPGPAQPVPAQRAQPAVDARLQRISQSAIARFCPRSPSPDKTTRTSRWDDPTRRKRPANERKEKENATSQANSQNGAPVKDQDSLRTQPATSSAQPGAPNNVKPSSATMMSTSKRSLKDIPSKPPSALKRASTKSSSALEKATTKSSSKLEKATTKSSSTLEKATTKSSSTLEKATTKSSSTLEKATTKSSSMLEKATTKSSSTLEKATTKSSSTLEKATTKPSSALEKATTKSSSALERGKASKPASALERGTASKPASALERGTASKPASALERGTPSKPASALERGTPSKPVNILENGTSKPSSMLENGTSKPSSMLEKGTTSKSSSTLEKKTSTKSVATPSCTSKSRLSTKSSSSPLVKPPSIDVLRHKGPVASTPRTSNVAKETSTELSPRGIEDSGLLQPQFNSSYRIPKKAPSTPLPNPLRNPPPTPSVTPVSQTPSTWLQTRPNSASRTPKKLTPPSNVQCTSVQSACVIDILEGRTSINLIEEVEVAKRKPKPTERKEVERPYLCKRKGGEPQTEEAKKRKNEKEKDREVENRRKRHKSRKSRKDDDVASKSASKKAHQKKKSYEEDKDWAPSSSRKSRASTPVSPCLSPARSGVASRTRSRTRSPSFKTTNNGFSCRYSSESESEEEAEIGSQFDIQRITEWLQAGAASPARLIEQTSPVTPPAVQSSLQCSLRDNQIKKQLLQSKSNYISMQEWQQREITSHSPVPSVSSPVNCTPPMPVLERADDLPPGLRADMPNIAGLSPTSASTIPTDVQATPVSNVGSIGLTPASSAASIVSSPSAAAVVSEVVRSESPDIILIENDKCIEFIDLSDCESSSEDVHDLPFPEMWAKLNPLHRQYLEELSDSYRLATKEVDSYIEKFNLNEKIRTVSLRRKEHQTTKDHFISRFNNLHVQLLESKLKLLPAFTEEKLYQILQKKIDADKKLDADYGELKVSKETIADLQYLFYMTFNKTTAASPERQECLTSVRIATKLFKMHQTKSDYLASRPQETVGQVSGIRPLGPKTEPTTVIGVAEPPRTPSRDSGYLSPPHNASGTSTALQNIQAAYADVTDLICDYCTKPAEIKCSGCHSSLYCSVDCQKIHWNLIHRDTCAVNERT